VIDHSSQHKETLFERCWYAFKDNAKILSDTAYAADVRNKYKGRLLENRQKFLAGQMSQHILSEISSWKHCGARAKELYTKEFLLNYGAII